MTFEQQAPLPFFQFQDSTISLMDRKTKYESWPRRLTWLSFKDSGRSPRPYTTTTSVRASSYRTAAARTSPAEKNIFWFFACLAHAWGRGG